MPRLKPTLLENSYSFLNEALRTVVEVKEDHRRWHFAMLFLTRAIERARKLRQGNVIDEKTEYVCRFVQHYRDFIHRARNLTHSYALNVNINKMCLIFFVLLLEDLGKVSNGLAQT